MLVQLLALESGLPAPAPAPHVLCGLHFFTVNPAEGGGAVKFSDWGEENISGSRGGRKTGPLWTPWLALSFLGAKARRDSIAQQKEAPESHCSMSQGREAVEQSLSELCGLVPLTWSVRCLRSPFSRDNSGEHREW